MVRVAQRVTRGGFLQADERVDVAGVGVLDRVLLVRVHLEELAHALLLGLRGVEHLLARDGLAGVHAHVGEFAEERVHGDLERQRGERLVHRRLTRQLVVAVNGGAVDLADVQRARQVVNDSVQQRLDALVAVCGTAEHRVDLGVDRHLADGCLDLFLRQLLAAEVLLHEFFVRLGDGLEQLLAVLLSLLLQIRRDLLDLRRGAGLDLARPHERLHVDEVDNAVEVVLSADRQLHNQRLCAEAVDDGADGVVEVSAQLVHLVHEADARDVVLGSLAPHLLGLRLDALLAVEHGNSAIEHAQGALHLNGEVHVTRGVDDVDLVVVPEAGHGSGGNGDAALLFLLHPVGGRTAVVGLSDLAVDTRVEEDALGRGGLTSIDVGHDADVADLCKILKHFLCHVDYPNLCVVDAARRRCRSVVLCQFCHYIADAAA